MKKLLLGVLLVLSTPAFATTWFVRTDGGTRYDATNAPTGQCNGKADASYASTGGTGVNQACAYQDFRYLYDDDAGTDHYTGAWVISGGDTVIIRGCTAGVNQIYPSNPNCRIGWDRPSGGSLNNWCYFSPNVPFDCYSAPIPSGTATQHTRILGENYASCNTSNNPKDYSSRLTQLFAGFGDQFTINLVGSQYVDLECLEITTHNQVSPGNAGAGGNCNQSTGSPAYPQACSTSSIIDDFAQNGIKTSNTTANVTLQDVYIHGFTHDGIQGPIGGVLQMTRVFVGFNAQAGINFDDGSDTPDGAGSQILASYVWVIGNGCFEQYPIVSAFPARACYDNNSGGFGDAWSGQDTVLDVFHCDHCVTEYNTKDAFIGPHTQVADLAITNSVAIGNMGTAWKWGNALNATTLFQNNLTVSNCYRMGETVPGAPQNFNVSTGLGGSYLSNYCRAGGNSFQINTRPGSVNHFYGNTIIAANPTIFEGDCGFYTSGNVFNQEDCSTVPNTFKDNLYLGYIDPNTTASAPGLYLANAGSNYQFTGSYADQFGIRNADTCGANGVICSSPNLQSQPSQTWANEAALDVFNPFAGSGNSFYPVVGSPVIGTGNAVSGLTADYYGTVRPSSPSMGAVEFVNPDQTATPSITPSSGTVSLSVTLADTTSGAVICYNFTGSPATNGAGTGCGAGSTLYTGAITVATASTLYAIAQAPGFTSSLISNGTYTAPAAASPTITGSATVTGSFSIQ